MSASRVRPGSSRVVCRVCSSSSRTMLAIRSSLAGWVIASSDCSRASGVGGTGMAWTTSAGASWVCSSLMPTNLAPGGSGALAERSQEQRLGLRHPHDLAEVHALVARVVVRQMIRSAPYQDLDTRKRLDQHGHERDRAARAHLEYLVVEGGLQRRPGRGEYRRGRVDQVALTRL